MKVSEQIVENKSIVYWASPTEAPTMLINNVETMVTNNLVKTRIILDKILDHIHPDDKVGVKVHVGESYNTRYLRHDYVREVVKAIKFKGGIPILIETNGIGENIQHLKINENYSIDLGHRKKTTDHQKIAHLHGYTESITGAPLQFIDGDDGIDRKVIKVDGIHFNQVSVAAGLFKFDKLVIISHFKGHHQAGFGGALKNLGIGCVSKHNKFLAHFESTFNVNSKRCDISKCEQECIKSCPVNSIKIESETAVIDASTCYGCFKCAFKCPIKNVIKSPRLRPLKDFVECFIDNATAVLSFGHDKVRYINFALDIPLRCECTSNSSMPVVPDLGIFGSSDPLAIDKACVDAEIKAPGLPFLDKDKQWTKPIEPGIEKFKALNALIDIKWQIEAAIRNKLGSIDYELVEI